MEEFNFAKMLDDNEDLITLQMTHKIQNEDAPEWISLKKDYKNCPNNFFARPILSIINAIITQRRIYFVLTRKWTLKLTKNDKNHNKKNVGFRTENWKLILAKAYKWNVFEKVKTINNITLYKVTKPSLVKLLTVNADEQYKKCIKYMSEGTEEGTDKGTEDGTDNDTKQISNPAKEQSSIQETKNRRYLSPGKSSLKENPKDVTYEGTGVFISLGEDRWDIKNYKEKDWKKLIDEIYFSDRDIHNKKELLFGFREKLNAKLQQDVDRKLDVLENSP